ncbi:MAG: hypothetical protein ACP5QS_00750, partial [bacterium]
MRLRRVYQQAKYHLLAIIIPINLLLIKFLKCLDHFKEKGGDIFAEGIIKVVPREGEAIAVLPVIGQLENG